MGRNKKPGKPAPKTKSATVTPIKGPPAETQVAKPTTSELSKKVLEVLGDNAAGFAFVVAGSDGLIVPHVGARSIGDLLTLKHVLKKELLRVVDSVAYPKAEGESASAVQ